MLFFSASRLFVKIIARITNIIAIIPRKALKLVLEIKFWWSIKNRFKIISAPEIPIIINLNCLILNSFKKTEFKNNLLIFFKVVRFSSPVSSPGKPAGARLVWEGVLAKPVSSGNIWQMARSR
jgi:hypothetical protein